MRSKEHLVIIRPFESGLMLHTMYYQDEIRCPSDVDRGAERQDQDKELELAQRLIDDLTEKKFDPSEYHGRLPRARAGSGRIAKLPARSVDRADRKQPRGKVIDLMSALKASLKKRGVSVNEIAKKRRLPPKARIAKSPPARADPRAAAAPADFASSSGMNFSALRSPTNSAMYRGWSTLTTCPMQSRPTQPKPFHENKIVRNEATDGSWRPQAPPPMV